MCISQQASVRIPRRRIPRPDATIPANLTRHPPSRRPPLPQPLSSASNRLEASAFAQASSALPSGWYDVGFVVPHTEPMKAPRAPHNPSTLSGYLGNGARFPPTFYSKRMQLVYREAELNGAQMTLVSV